LRQGAPAIGHNDLRNAVVQSQAVGQRGVPFDHDGSSTRLHGLLDEAVAVGPGSFESDETVAPLNSSGIIPKSVDSDILCDRVAPIRRLMELDNSYTVQQLAQSHSINSERS